MQVMRFDSAEARLFFFAVKKVESHALKSDVWPPRQTLLLE